MSTPSQPSILPLSTADTTPREDLTSPGLIHDIDVVDESPVGPQTPSETAASSKAPSLKENSATCSVREIDVERADGNTVLDEKSLATYIVPVLDKGVKTALSKPSSPWTLFRIWYNPYRMVCSFLLLYRRP